MTTPVVAITFGDASGIGPELVARFLTRPEISAAQIVLVGDAWVWAQGQKIAGVSPVVNVIKDWSAARRGAASPRKPTSS